MKRKTLIIFGFFILIFFSLIFIVLVPKETNQQTQPDNTEATQQQEEQKNDANEEADENDSNIDESKQKVRNIISDMVQRTVNFFSNKDTNIVAVGDSLTQGVGDDENAGGYVGIVDRTINEEEQLVNVQNFGKRGDRTDQLLVKLNDPKISTSISDADIVLITIGANDIMKIVKENISHLTYNQFVDERADYEERLRDIFEQIDTLNDEADIYLVGFYNPFEKYFPEIDELGVIVDDWNKTGKKVATEHDNITYIPTKDLFENENIELLADDNFHPNHTGYERMAKRVLNYLTEKER